MAKDTKDRVMVVMPAGSKVPLDVNDVGQIVTYANPLSDVHFVGLKKVGPMKYAVVSGTLGAPVVDNVAQPLEYAAEAAKLAWHKLLDVVP